MAAQNRHSTYLTAQVETVTDCGAFDINQFVDLYKAVAASPKPAVIVLQEVGGNPDYAAHCGEVMATMMTRTGAMRKGPIAL